MEETSDLQAFDALAKHARLPDLVALVRLLAASAAEARAADWKAPAKLKALAEERKLDSKEAATDAGDALAILEHGPKSAPERALARALWAHAVAEARPKSTEDEDRLAKSALWLAAHTPFDATRLFDRALGDEAAELWAAIADRVRQIDLGTGDDVDRGEALIGAAALGASTSDSAKKAAKKLATEVSDPALARLLRQEKEEVAPTKLLREPSLLRGEVFYAPRGVVTTTFLALSGLLCVIHLFRLSGRAALGYKKPATVAISESGARVSWRTEILGRTLRDRDLVIGREGLASVLREVRYPRTAFYAGLFFLALGSFVGVRTLADGVRSASPTLLLAGLVFVALGIGLDFVLGSLVPGATGRCRLFLVPRAGASICVQGVDAKSVDLALARLATPLT
jgi:hypothetical protein